MAGRQNSYKENSRELKRRPNKKMNDHSSEDDKERKVHARQVPTEDERVQRSVACITGELNLNNQKVATTNTLINWFEELYISKNMHF